MLTSNVNRRITVEYALDSLGGIIRYRKPAMPQSAYHTNRERFQIVKDKSANSHNVRRVIKQHMEDGDPLRADDLRELAVEIGEALSVHPSCIMKSILPEIERLLNEGDSDIVHVDGVLRPRLSGEPATPTKREQRARSEQRRHERHALRRAAEQNRRHLLRLLAEQTADSVMIAIA